MNEPKYIILHHTGVSRSKQKYQAWPVNNYHKSLGFPRSTLGFYGGYHYIIEPTGYTIQYKREHEEGAHTIGHNKDSVGICLVGNFDMEMPTTEQIVSFKKLVGEIKKRRSIDSVKMHKEMQNFRTCPGNLITTDWLNNLFVWSNPSSEDEIKKKLLEQQLSLLKNKYNLLLQLLRSLIINQ